MTMGSRVSKRKQDLSFSMPVRDVLRQKKYPYQLHISQQILLHYFHRLLPLSASTIYLQSKQVKRTLQDSINELNI